MLAFSDAVFAIAMTLLVVGIEIPDLSDADSVGELADALSDDLAAFISFVISFLVIGRYWVAHHAFFSRLAAVDNGLIGINLIYLLFIAFLPFPTGLLGNFFDNPLSIVVYATTWRSSVRWRWCSTGTLATTLRQDADARGRLSLGDDALALTGDLLHRSRSRSPSSIRDSRWPSGSWRSRSRRSPTGSSPSAPTSTSERHSTNVPEYSLCGGVRDVGRWGETDEAAWAFVDLLGRNPPRPGPRSDSGEGGIRTHEATFAAHTISSRAP